MPRISGDFTTGCFGGNWVVRYSHNPTPYNPTCTSVIVAYCESEGEAKELKRKLQNSLNNQKRKLGATAS